MIKYKCYKNTSNNIVIVQQLFTYHHRFTTMSHHTLTAGHRKQGREEMTTTAEAVEVKNNNIPHQFSNAICHQLHNLQFVVWGLKRVSLLGIGWSTSNTFSAHFAAVRNSSSKLNVIFLFFSLYFRWKLFFWCLLVLRLYGVFLN